VLIVNVGIASVFARRRTRIYPSDLVPRPPSLNRAGALESYSNGFVNTVVTINALLKESKKYVKSFDLVLEPKYSCPV